MLEEQVTPLLERFLGERGLDLSRKKTKITHIEQGFDFLGQNVRKYNGKLLIKSSRKSIKSFLAKVRATIKAATLIRQAPQIRVLVGHALGTQPLGT